METPPRALGRLLAVIIALFFVVAVGWAAVSPVDIVAVADGKLVPAGQVKTIQPFQSGVVRSIDVAEGQHVSAGQSLIVLDAAEVVADRERSLLDLAQSEMDRRIAEALLQPDPPSAFLPPSDAPAEAVELARAIVAGRWQNQTSALEANAAEASRLAAALGALADQRLASDESRQEIEDLLASIVELERQGLSTRSQVTNLRLQLINARSQLQSIDQQLVQAQLGLDESRASRAQLKASFLNDVRQQLSQALQSALVLKAGLRRLDDREKLYRLTAPVAGFVNELAIHTIGGVVTPSERLLTIIPDGVGLEVEARLPNKDIAFVSVGQRAQIKLEPFPFTRFGTVGATVTGISPDAIIDPNSGPIYAMRLRPDDVPATGPVRLSSGMRATAEIHTGDRTVLDFFLTPLLRYRDEAIRER